MNSDHFSTDVLKGLSATPKTLPSKYFYDENGNALFQTIMDLEDYYLTRSEFEIISLNLEELFELFYAEQKPINLIELGAGDGLKIKLLLKELLQRHALFTYVPIDISSHALTLLSHTLKDLLPHLSLNGICSDYFQALQHISQSSDRHNIVLFLGSSIGNLTLEESLDFLKKIRLSLNSGDLLMIGFDLKKDPYRILRAYSDRLGITRAFNLNLLKRINEELSADFDLDSFDHYATYNPLTGTAKSYLISMKAQNVLIQKISQSFSFQAWESIHTEISQKYDLVMIDMLAAKSGFKVVKNFYDCQGLFLDSVWEKSHF